MLYLTTMQKKTFLLFFLVVHFFIVQSQSFYQIKSCKIDFVFDNGYQKGTTTVIFSDSGKIEKELGVVYLDTTKMVGLPAQIPRDRTVFHTLVIQTTDSVWSIDLDLMKGSKRTRINFHFSPLCRNQDKKIGEGVFLNKICEIRDSHGIKMWYWKGLTLKMEMSHSPNERVYKYATAIDEDYIIKEDEFKIPDGIKMN
jgi:hypothetical protein